MRLHKSSLCDLDRQIHLSSGNAGSSIILEIDILENNKKNTMKTNKKLILFLGESNPGLPRLSTAVDDKRKS